MTDGPDDAIAIFPDQPAAASTIGDEDAILPSGQPRWGQLKEGDEPSTSHPPPLRRKYSKQKHWDEMDFPRPMSKDRLSDMAAYRHQSPHLAPNHRHSRINYWRPPSFAESLDTLIHSRCNRQILLFSLGFLCPLFWMIGALLPLPKKPSGARDVEKGDEVPGDSTENLRAAMMNHYAGEAERTWQEEKTFLKATWWRTINRVMSVVGVLVIGAVIALAVIATR